MAAINHTLQSVINEQVQYALRAGMPLESVIVTLISTGEQLQAMLPFVKAAAEARHAP